MPLFRRVRTQIEDEVFLEIKWNRNFNLKNKVLDEIIKELDNDENTRHTKIESNLPYVTIFNAERLFSAIAEYVTTEDLKEVVIDKVQLIYQDKDNEASSKDQLFIKPLKITSDYRNLLKPLAESMFNDRKFEKFDYDQKVDYLADNLFGYFAEYLGLDDSDYPILPTEDEIQMAKKEGKQIKVFYPSELGKEENRFPSDSSTEVIGGSTADFPGESNDLFNPEQMESAYTQQDGGYSTEWNENEVDDDPMDSFYSESEDTEEPTIENSEPKAIAPKANEQPNSEPKEKINDYVPPRPDNEQVIEYSRVKSNEPLRFNFPRFDTAEFSKEAYEPHEPEYVAWKLNEFKKEQNQFLEQQEATNERWAQHAVEQKLMLLERREATSLKQKLLKNDKRKYLKDKVMTEVKNDEKVALAKALSELAKDHKKKLNDFKIEYERLINEENQKYATTQENTKKELHDKYFQKFQEEYEDRYYKESAELEKIRADGVAMIDKKRNAKEKELAIEQNKVATEVGKKLYRESSIKVQKREQQLQHEHDIARQEWNLAQQEKLKADIMQKHNEHSEMIEADLKRLNERNEHLEKENKAAQERLLEQREESLADSAALIERMSKQPQVITPTAPITMNGNASKAKGNTWAKGLLFGFAGLLLGIGGMTGFNYIQHVERQQAAQTAAIKKISADLKDQRDENKKLTSQRDKARSQAEQANKRVDEINDEVKELKDKLGTDKNKTNNQPTSKEVSSDTQTQQVNNTVKR